MIVISIAKISKQENNTHHRTQMSKAAGNPLTLLYNRASSLLQENFFLKHPAQPEELLRIHTSKHLPTALGQANSESKVPLHSRIIFFMSIAKVEKLLGRDLGEEARRGKKKKKKRLTRKLRRSWKRIELAK